MNPLAVLETIKDLDLLILRGHALIEAQLWSQLASRLGVKEHLLPELTFEKLARLALAGAKFEKILSIVLTFNNIRNGIAHQFDPSVHRARLREFIAGVPLEIRVNFQDDQSGIVSIKEATADDWPAETEQQLHRLRAAFTSLIVSIVFIGTSHAPPKYDVGKLERTL